MKPSKRGLRVLKGLKRTTATSIANKKRYRKTFNVVVAKRQQRLAR